MSDATPEARVPEDPTTLRHLEMVEAEVSRHRQNALRIRLGALAVVAGYVALHGAQSQPRYMFLAPVLALAGWALDAHAEWNVNALRLLASAVRGETGPRPPSLTLDARPFSDRVSWRRALLRPARAMFFHPLTVIAAYVSVDAPRLDPEGVPSELFWYLAVTFMAFLAVVIVAWSWWYDHFGETATPPAWQPQSQAQPRALDAKSSLQGSEGPFPSAPKSEHTRPFGTAVG